MKNVLFAALVCAALSLCGCGSCFKSAATSETPGIQTPLYHTITAEEAYMMMDGGGNFVLLDVRTESEFGEARIDGAILIPDSEIKERAAEELPDKDAVILVYCRSGRRSTLAAEDLAGMGYANVYDFGGIIDWPYKTVSGDD